MTPARPRIKGITSCVPMMVAAGFALELCMLHLRAGAILSQLEKLQASLVEPHNHQSHQAPLWVQGLPSQRRRCAQQVVAFKGLGLTSAAQELQREWEAETAKAKEELSPEQRKRGLHSSLAKRSFRIIKLNETLDAIDKELEDVQKRRDEAAADLEREQLACENERAEVALLEQAASRPLDPGDVPQVLFTVKEDSIKGNPELETMVKAVEQAKLAFNNAVVQFQNKFKDITAAAAESTAAAEGASAPKGAAKRGAPGEDAPGGEAEEPMHVDIEDADKAAISSLATELDLDPNDQSVQNKVWGMLQEGIIKRRKNKKSS